MTQELPPIATTILLHLTVDPYWDSLTAIAFGRVDDGLPPAQCPALEEEERIGFLLDGPNAGPVIGFRVAEPHAVDALALSSDEVWSGPRFEVPALGLVAVSVGEVLLAVQARYREGEPTADALYFHAAIAAGEETARTSSKRRAASALRWRPATSRRSSAWGTRSSRRAVRARPMTPCAATPS